MGRSACVFKHPARRSLSKWGYWHDHVLVPSSECAHITAGGDFQASVSRAVSLRAYLNSSHGVWDTSQKSPSLYVRAGKSRTCWFGLIKTQSLLLKIRFLGSLAVGKVCWKRSFPVLNSNNISISKRLCLENCRSGSLQLQCCGNMKKTLKKERKS